MITEQWPLWVGFTLFIFGMLALDLGVFQRKSHTITMKEAMVWFGVWTGLALLFNVGIILFHERGTTAGLEFFTGFIVEKSLSVDNIFVFILIFNFFRVPQPYQHKVLFWGIVGAIFLRIIFIVAGLSLLERFHWMIYLFGGFLLITGIGMLYKKDVDFDPEQSWLIRFFRRHFPVATRYDGNRFFTRVDGKRLATPLLLVLLAVESSDIIFAVDSIPAIFSITSDPFIVYTSNIFAMLGLRALYFGVAGFMRMFHLLHYGFASIILILGIKMLLSEFYKVPVAVSLVLIMVILLLCVIVSLLRPRRADLKTMFERPQRLGLMPFRRLLLIENIVDMADLTVRDAMRMRSGVRVVHMDLPWEENLKLLRETRFSRYPMVENGETRPTRVLHLKDIVLWDKASPVSNAVIAEIARPSLEMREDLPLEEALTKFQSAFNQMAIVSNAQGEWTGIITIEDVLEELVGKIGDEFDVARSGQFVSLADALTPERVIFELSARSMNEAIETIISQIPRQSLPGDPRKIVQAVRQREQVMNTYLGSGLAIPHCRLDGIEQPVLIFARSDEGVPMLDSSDRVELIFLLLTPIGMARIQPRLLADIVGIIESEYVTERLRKATEPDEVIEAVRAGQQVVLD